MERSKAVRRRPPRRYKEPTCVHCGCTEMRACPGGCAWSRFSAMFNAGVCTICEWKVMKIKVKEGF